MDCYFKRDNNCSVTLRKDCEKCSMRKTEQEVKEGRERARARISSLPLEQQIDISEKYYIRVKAVL